MASLSSSNVSYRRVYDTLEKSEVRTEECRTEKKQQLVRIFLTSCCFFSGSSETTILRSTTLFFSTLSKLIAIEAHLVFTGNLSVQFTFSAFCIAFNMSTSMCLCLNSLMTPFSCFIIFFSGFKFYHIAKNQIETVRSTSAADNCWIFVFYKSPCFFHITCVVCVYSKSSLAALTF